MPVLIAGFAVFVAIRGRRPAHLLQRLIMIFLAGGTAFLAAFAIMTVVLFWMDPYARGGLIGL